MNTASAEVRLPSPGPAASHRDGVHVCRCGQELDTITGDHCPRCGTALRAPHAAR